MILLPLNATRDYSQSTVQRHLLNLNSHTCISR